MAAVISSVAMQLLLVVTCMMTLVSLNIGKSEPIIAPPRSLDHRMDIQGLQECQGSFIGFIGCLQEILKIFNGGGGIPEFGGDARGLGTGGGGDEGEGEKGGDTGGLGGGDCGDDQEGGRGEGGGGGDLKEGDKKQRKDEKVQLTDFGGGLPGIGGGLPGFGGGIPVIGGGTPGEGGGLISSTCCKAISGISNSCWSVLFPLFPDPPNIIDKFCAPLSV